MSEPHVALTVGGKFHHFHLARQLHKRGMLEKIITCYPEWKLQDQALPSDKIYSASSFYLAWHAIQRTPLRDSWLAREVEWHNKPFLGKTASKVISPNTNTLIGLSTSGLEAGKHVQANGGIYICDRGSSHISFQNQILTEEFARWGEKFRGIDPRVIEREQAEYEQANAILCPSEFVRQSFIKLGMPENKIFKVPYGADVSRFFPDGEPKENQFNILFIGQVSFRKGIPYLFEAFSKIKHPNKKLTVIGSVQTEMKHFLENIKESDNVEYLGIVSHNELKSHISKSHVMVLPSVEEGLALVLSEALACGCPVIATTNTGATDLITDGVEGFIVPIRDSNAIADRLERLVQDKDLATSMRHAALKKVKNIGGWDHYGDGITKLIKSKQ